MSNGGADLCLFDCLLDDEENGDVVFMNETSSNLMLETDKNTTSSINTADLLTSAMTSTGLINNNNNANATTAIKIEDNWPTEDLLDSLLKNSDLDLLNSVEKAISEDGSDDSGLNMLSPSSSSNSSEDDDLQYMNNVTAVNPITNSPCTIATTANNKAIPIRIVTNNTANSANIQTGTTTIVLPVMATGNSGQSSSSSTKIQIQSPAPKRRRTSASSNDSGCFSNESNNSKYPPLNLNEEEKRLCEREGVKLPSHYPLSREEEKNLKRIRRKIRNKVSAQDSRKRKKEYVDAMEDRVKACTDQNEELTQKIQLLETQNRTLAGQLKRLQQIIVNGGLKNSQTSTAMMVLLLSTALFLLPGFNKEGQGQGQNGKCDLDVITQAIKMPPMPGQSRSLLQHLNSAEIKQEHFEDNVVIENNANAVENNKVKVEPLDHDYFSAGGKVGSYIEEDAPPQGYGPAKGIGATNTRKRTAAEMGDDRVGGMERRINVTRGPGNQGMRTVVLHVPKDIK